MISLKPRRMLLPIEKSLHSTPPSLTSAVSGRLALGPGAGDGGRGSVKCVSSLELWHLFFFFSIPGNIPLSLKSKSPLATCSPEAGSWEGDSNWELVLGCGLNNYLGGTLNQLYFRLSLLIENSSS